MTEDGTTTALALPRPAGGARADEKKNARGRQEFMHPTLDDVAPNGRGRRKREQGKFLEQTQASSHCIDMQAVRYTRRQFRGWRQTQASGG